jgi:hypothetical protein
LTPDIHKECELKYVERLYPANHYVLIDDKLHIRVVSMRSGKVLRPAWVDGCLPRRRRRDGPIFWHSIPIKATRDPQLT